MSELIAYKADVTIPVYGTIADEQVYLKSEADKYIGELKKERDWLAKDRAQAYDDLEKRAQLNIKLEESNRHQKYKRCLAMVERCKDKIENPMQYNEHDDWLIINEYWERWRWRWENLAEKFKEARNV